jgi:hypothetical protein
MVEPFGRRYETTNNPYRPRNHDVFNLIVALDAPSAQSFPCNQRRQDGIDVYPGKRLLEKFEKAFGSDILYKFFRDI